MRTVLRPGVLWVCICRFHFKLIQFQFLRDPNDPDFHPLRQMLERSLFRYARRLALVSMMYGGVTFLVVWVPVRCCRLLAPSLLPYTLTLQYPVELLSLNLAIPFVQVVIIPLVESLNVSRTGAVGPSAAHYKGPWSMGEALRHTL